MALLAGMMLCLAACGGGAPLLHPAHVLAPGDMSVGAGIAGQFVFSAVPPLGSSDEVRALQTLGVAPAPAPWMAGRMGISGANEMGLTLSSRFVRLDARHAFALGNASLSVGLGASAVMAHRPGDGRDASGVLGGGADIPLLFGVRSANDVYALWLGPRAGFESVRGRLQRDANPSSVVDVSAWQAYGGFVMGMRVGFRHVHAAIEVDAGYHAVQGTFKTASVAVQPITLTPAGALEISF